MDYRSAFIILYGSAGAALEYLTVAEIKTKEHNKAIDELKKAIKKVEAMADEDE